MIENWRCKSCRYTDADQSFYKPGKNIAICPKCGSEDIVAVGKYIVNPK
jgi:predicted Zn-ribbon and HTH transcriptional regulator